MRVGIVVALEDELAPFLENKQYTVEQTNNYTVYCIDIAGKKVFIARQFYVGVICSSATTQMLITKYAVEVILNFGVVGALTKHAQVQDVMLVEGVVHYDMDTSKVDNTDVGRYLIFDELIIPTSRDLIDIAKSIDSSLPSVICASADKFVDNKLQKEYLNQQFGAQICDMESAGIVITAQLNNVKVLLVKAVSDSLAGDGDEYEQNLAVASRAYVEFVTQLLEII